MHRRNAFVLGFLTFLFSEHAFSRNPVIVTMGGFNSCYTDDNGYTPRGGTAWKKGTYLAGKYARGTARWVRSCFDKWGRLYFVTAGNPGHVRSTKINNPRLFVDAVYHETEGGANPVFLIGHSYGGWLAMHTTRALPGNVQVRSMQTVDPISPSHCNPSHYIAAIMQPVTYPFKLAGCQRAPSDMTEKVRKSLVERLPQHGWRHFYQRIFLPLRSSAYQGRFVPHLSIDASSHLRPNGSLSSLNAHAAIDDLEMVWYAFEGSIENDLKRDP